MKRLVVCLDGTWQNITQNETGTNIAHIAQSVSATGPGPDGGRVSQITYYSRGVGAPPGTGDESWWSKMTGGGFGAGLEENVLSAYIFLALNYEPKDEIYIFGFSRGAFTARSLAGMVGKVGLLRRQQVGNAGRMFKLYREEFDPDVLKKKKADTRLDIACHADVVNVHYLGIFDTVGMRGIPGRGGLDVFGHNKKYGFHDLRLKDHVLSARHACAIDEMRNAFPVTPWTNLKTLNEARGFAGPALHAHDAPYQQKWFAGQHGDVGGGLEGDGKSMLSDIPLRWIVQGAIKMGLAFDDTAELGSPYYLRCGARRCDPLRGATPVGGGFLNVLGKDDRVIDLGNRRAPEANDTVIPMARNDCATAPELMMHLHPTTLYRVVVNDVYYPNPLKLFMGLPGAGVFARLFGGKPRPDARDVVIAGMGTGRAATEFEDYDAFETHLLSQRIV